MAKRTCDVPGCDRPHLSRGYCSAHWQRWKKTGDPGPAWVRPPRAQRDPICTVEGCERPHTALGYCSLHAHRFRAKGSPGGLALSYPVRGLCTVNGCDDPHSAQGYCSSHYARWRRKGDAGAAFTVRRRDPRARDAQGRKQCRACDEWLPLVSFCKHASHPDGLSTRCRMCHYAAGIARRYGLEPSWYMDTLARQGGGCAICGARPNGKRLHVDHDHSHCAANKGCPECVRGLLCSPCNTGIGMLGESADRLAKATAYLRSWR